MYDCLDEFFDEDEAVSAIYKGKIFNGYFDKEFVESGRMSGYAPIFTCITAEHEAIKLIEDEQIEIEQKTFTVREIQPDGTGVSVLVLSHDT